MKLVPATTSEKLEIRGLYTERLAAAYLGKGVETVAHLRMTGELGFIEKWGQILYPKFELDNWMKRNLVYQKDIREKWRTRIKDNGGK